MADFRTPLYSAHAAAGARMGEYRGVETALAFGEPRLEFSALLQSCGVSDLGWLGRMIAAGPDRQRWLNGMVTNNVRDLPLDHCNYNFVLNAQGRIQGDLLVANRGEYLLLETSQDQLQKLHELLDRFIIMDDVELTLAGEITALGITGPQAARVLEAAGISVASMEPMQVRDAVLAGGNVTVARTGGAYDYEIWLGQAHVEIAWASLLAAGGSAVGAEAVEWLRIYRGVPRCGVDIQERHLAQETAQEHALNFAKGCYIGQEIVERVRSRGQVHRRLLGFIFDGPPPAPGSKVQSAGKDVGEVTSGARLPLPEGELNVALGYVRNELAPPGAEIFAGESRGVVSQLPFAAARVGNPING